MLACNQERWHLGKMTQSRKGARAGLLRNNVAWDGGRTASGRVVGKAPVWTRKQTNSLPSSAIPAPRRSAVWIISSFVVVKDCVDTRHCEESKLKLHLCAEKGLGVHLYPCFAMGLLFKSQYKSLCKNQNTFCLCNVPDIKAQVQ